MIDKVGGIILKDKKILVQRKNNNREECIIPGGKRENNETDIETLSQNSLPRAVFCSCIVMRSW